MDDYQSTYRDNRNYSKKLLEKEKPKRGSIENAEWSYGNNESLEELLV